MHTIVRVVQHTNSKSQARVYERGRACPLRQHLTSAERFMQGALKEAYWLARKTGAGFELLHITKKPEEWW